MEDRVREIGGEILERARVAEPGFWREAWWQQHALNLSMEYETLKVQAFRFVDVLPSILDRPESIARHLKEYLDPDRFDLPGIVRLILGYRTNDSNHARFVAEFARFAAMQMAKRFIAGSNAEQAIESVLQFRRRKMAFTLDVLGEFTSSDTQAERYRNTYINLIESLCPAADTWSPVPIIDSDIAGPSPRVNISIKLTALSARFDAIDPERSIASVSARLRPILRKARELGAFINVDMESYGYRALTLELFKRVLMEDEFRDFTQVGIVVQAYLRDGEQDYEDLLTWVKKRGHPIAVRLVKGAYWDVETAMATQNNTPAPVWLRKWESDACFERIARRMLENHRWIQPAFASHNVRSIAYIMARAEAIGLDRRRFEFQMLNGMGDPLKDAVVNMGYRLRVYTPYGGLISGMGYLIRRLLENTANDSFLRQSFDTRDASRLLADPAVAQPPSTSPRPIRYLDIDEDEPMTDFRNEPTTGFTAAENRDKFKSALDFVRGEFGREYPLAIGGTREKTAAWIESTNPANPVEIVGRCASATTADADRAVAAAHAALPQWRHLSLSERATYLRKAADAMRKRRFEMAAFVVFEVGKPWREADADVAEAIDYLNYYAACAERLENKPRRRDLPGEDNYRVYEPKGVCAVIATWSFPLALLTNMTAAALVTGNAVVVKPSSHAPVIAAKLQELFEQIGLPAGVLNYLPGSGATVGRRLVSHADVNIISFTGSREIGSGILSEAAVSPAGQQHIKKVIAELGGKNAIIIDDDADLDEAVAGVVESAFGFSGQKCTACSRTVVLAHVYDAFCARLVETTSQLTIGPAEDPATIIGPVISAEAQQHLAKCIDHARNGGRMLLDTPANSLPSTGCFIGPTIVGDVDPDSNLAHEELFGPVLAVMRANDFTHALEIANGTHYALTGGVYSRSPANVEQAKREFLVGNLYLNRKITGSRVDIEPFGGLKLSGDGAKAGGPDYLDHYCNTRTITEHTLRHGLAPAQEVQTRA